MTEKHQLLTDQQFEKKFEDCSLPPALVTYEAHLRLAYIHVKKYGFKKAVINLCKQLTAFSARFGNILILTKASIKAFVTLIYEFITKSTTTSFRALLMEFPDLKNNISAFLTQQHPIEISNEIPQPETELTGFSIL